MIKTPPPSIDWPNGYLTWSGSFDDLVATATQIITFLEPTVKPLTARTARNYQAAGVLGAGRRQGRRAVFGFQDLQALVVAKGLMRRAWPLQAAASLINSEPASAHNVMYISASAPPCSSVGQIGLAPNHPQVQPFNPLVSTARLNRAQRTIAELMAAAGSPGTVRPPPNLLGRPSSPSGRAIKVVDIDPACHVHLDEASITLMTPARRHDLAERLRSLADQLAPQNSPSPIRYK